MEYACQRQIVSKPSSESGFTSIGPPSHLYRYCSLSSVGLYVVAFFEKHSDSISERSSGPPPCHRLHRRYGPSIWLLKLSVSLSLSAIPSRICVFPVCVPYYCTALTSMQLLQCWQNCMNNNKQRRHCSLLALL